MLKLHKGSVSMIEKLSNLILEENCLKRNIDCSFDKKERTRLLTRLKIVQKEIREIKIKLRIEKTLKKEKEAKQNDFSNRSGEY